MRVGLGSRFYHSTCWLSRSLGPGLSSPVSLRPQGLFLQYIVHWI